MFIKIIQHVINFCQKSKLPRLEQLFGSALVPEGDVDDDGEEWEEEADNEDDNYDDDDDFQDQKRHQR